jgi:hypothetical protein
MLGKWVDILAYVVSTRLVVAAVDTPYPSIHSLPLPIRSILSPIHPRRHHTNKTHPTNRTSTTHHPPAKTQPIFPHHPPRCQRQSSRAVSPAPWHQRGATCPTRQVRGRDSNSLGTPGSNGRLGTRRKRLSWPSFLPTHF